MKGLNFKYKYVNTLTRKIAKINFLSIYKQIKWICIAHQIFKDYKKKRWNKIWYRSNSLYSYCIDCSFKRFATTNK